jgi:hypothetical protein
MACITHFIKRSHPIQNIDLKKLVRSFANKDPKTYINPVIPKIGGISSKTIWEYYTSCLLQKYSTNLTYFSFYTEHATLPL